MKYETTVVLPTYNEKENIVKMIDEILKYLKDTVEIIVVDDNSPDKTWEIVQKLKNKQVKLIRRFKDKGVGAAINAGIKKASGKYVFWMDCDLSMPPRILPKMIKMLKEHDVVVGSRYAPGGKDARGFVRVITSRAINLLSNIILNFKVLDYDSGFVGARKKVINTVQFDPRGHGEYCIEFLYKATRKKYSVKEIGYVFTERKKGESKTAQYIYSVFLYGAHYVFRIFKIKFQKI